MRYGQIVAPVRAVIQQKTHLNRASRPLVIKRREVIVVRSEEFQGLRDSGHRRCRGLYEILNRIQGRTVERCIRLLGRKAER